MAGYAFLRALWRRDWNGSKVISNVATNDEAEETANAIWNVSRGHYTVETNLLSYRFLRDRKRLFVMALGKCDGNASNVVSNVERNDEAEERANAFWNVSKGHYSVETNAISLMAETTNWNVSSFSFNVRSKGRSAASLNVVWNDSSSDFNRRSCNGGLHYANAFWNDCNRRNSIITNVDVTPFCNAISNAFPSPQLMSAIALNGSNFAYSVCRFYRNETTPKHRLGETYADFLELFSFRLIPTRFCDRTMTIPPRGCVKAGGFYSC